MKPLQVSCHEESISVELGTYICVTADEPINQLTADYPVCAVTYTFTQTHTGLHIQTAVDNALHMPF